MATYCTLIFDMGNVLISFSHEKMLNQIADLANVSLQTIQTLFLQQGLGLQLEKGTISPIEAYKALLEYSPIFFPFNEFIRAGCDIFSPRPEMTAIIKQLKQQGFRLLLLSNTNSAHFEYIQKNYDFLPLFDYWILSFKFKDVKPSKAIYEFTLSKAKAPPEKCLYIDDIPEYVAAAQKLGIQGHVYRSYPEFLALIKNHHLLI